ncbi:MAG: glycosyltransferase [Candidatus Omnitrophota bacterium]
MHKDEINNITNKLRSSLDDAASKDRIIQEKGNIIDQNNRHIEDLSKQLSFLHSELKYHQEEISNLSSKLSVSLDSILARDAIIFENNSQIDNLTKQLNDIQKELEAYKEESLNLANRLKVSLDSGLIKDNTILEKDHNIKKLSHQLSFLNNELQLHKEEITDLYDKLNKALDNILFKDNTILENNRNIEGLHKQLNYLQDELQSYKEETTILNNKLKENLDNSLLKDNTILENNLRIESLFIQLNSLQNELQAYKEEVSNLTDKLKISLDDGVSKDNIILEKSQQLENTANRLNETQKELKGIYSSEGFRFVLNPLWKIIWYSRIWSKKVIAKSSELIWSFVVLLLSPAFLVQVVFFALERVSELLFGNILRYFKKKREVVPFDKLTVSVVIPNWNGLELLKKCLSSLCETNDFKQGKYEILVVDDASRQSIADAIKDDFPGVRVIRNRYNQGFGKTCNRGVKEAKGELIVLLNNDIMVSKEFLEPLKAHFKDSEVFAVSPKLYYWDMKSFNYGMHMGKFKDGYLSLWNEAETGYGDKISQASPTVFAVGGAMCFRKKDFLWLEGFDEIYRPNCWEDIDISYRAQKRGLKVLYEPSSLMYHKGAATLNYIRHKEIKNELLFMWKNISDSDMFLSHINHLPKFLYYGRHSSRIVFLRGYLWAFNLLVSALVNRFKESGYVKLTDKKVLDRSMLYYRNFMRNGFAHRDRKTVLLITPFMIYPLNSGGKLRMYNLYRRLSEKYNIILLSLIHDEKEADYANSDLLKRVFKEIHVVHQKTPSNEFLFPERYKYSFSDFFIEKLKEIQETTPIDLIHIESNELLYLTRHVKHIPVVYTEHDISILSPHKSYYKKHITDIVSDFVDYLKIVRHHDYFYKKIDKIIALSKQDIKVMKAFAPGSDCSLVATGVDLERFKFQDKTGKNKTLVFVGHYPHYPNEEAAVYFCHNIFPIIKKSVPDVALKLVGSDPTENIKRLSNIEGVEVTGTVQDVRPYFQNASVFVCPFQTSAGIKGKVLEAMATGTPVVCTTRGSYGIDGKNGFSILIEDRPEDFANRVIELLQDDELYRKISRHARLLVEEKYDWNKIAQKLNGIYTDIMGRDMVINKVPDAGLNPADMDMRQAPSNNVVRDIIRKTDDVIGLSLEYLDKEGMRDINLNPEELHIELTHMCNSRCITCDIWDYHKRNNKSVKDEISLNEIKDFISNSKRLKDIKTVVLSGGEAFLRPDFVDICFAIKKLLPQASLGILSNGVNTEIVSSKTKEILKKISPESIWIGSSLDGLGETYDRVRGVSGGFDGFIRTLEFFKKELPGIRFSATFVLTPFNIDQLVPCWEFADKNNIDFFAQFAVPKEARSGDVFQWSDDGLLKIEGYINQIIERMIKKASNLEDFDKSLITAHDKINLLTKIYYWSHLVDYQKTQRRFAYNCDAAFKFAMLDPYGNMFFCPLLKHKAIGNVRSKNVDDIWASCEADEVRDFIGSGKCSCWLVCTVFPIVGKALSLYGDKACRDISIGGKTNILWQDFDVKHNHELNEEEFRRRKIVLESVPQGVTIGANYKCNANCAFCIGGNYKPFNLKLYKNYFEPRIGSMIKEADYVSFCGMGELLLVPDIKDFLKYVNVTLPDNNKILTTNGLALKNTLADIFTDSKYSIQISLHASNARLHEQITGLKGGFDKIIEQIRFTIARRKNAQSPHVTLVFVANTMNIEDLPNFVELAGSLAVDSVQVNYMTIFKTSHLKLSCFFMQEKANEIFDRAMARANELKINLNLPPRFSADRYFKSMCSDPWKNIYVDTEGAVLPCCYSGEHFGELRKNEVSSIWNNVKYQHIRTDLSSGNALAMCKYCLNSNPANVNLLNAHVSFRPEVQKLILNN